MKEVLTKSFWRSVKKTFDDARKDPPAPPQVDTAKDPDKPPPGTSSRSEASTPQQPTTDASEH